MAENLLSESRFCIRQGEWSDYHYLEEVYQLRMLQCYIFVRANYCWGLLEQLQVLATP